MYKRQVLACMVIKRKSTDYAEACRCTGNARTGKYSIYLEYEGIDPQRYLWVEIRKWEQQGIGTSISPPHQRYAWDCWSWQSGRSRILWKSCVIWVLQDCYPVFITGIGSRAKGIEHRIRSVWQKARCFAQTKDDKNRYRMEKIKQEKQAGWG